MSTGILRNDGLLEDELAARNKIRLSGALREMYITAWCFNHSFVQQRCHIPASETSEKGVICWQETELLVCNDVKTRLQCSRSAQPHFRSVVTLCTHTALDGQLCLAPLRPGCLKGCGVSPRLLG